MCVETISRKTMKNLPGDPAQAVRVTALLMLQWLRWTIVADRPDPIRP
jgi:hypothetical protein